MDERPKASQPSVSFCSSTAKVTYIFPTLPRKGSFLSLISAGSTPHPFFPQKQFTHSLVEKLTMTQEILFHTRDVENDITHGKSLRCWEYYSKNRNVRSLKLPIETKGAAREETVENVLSVTPGPDWNPSVSAETAPWMLMRCSTLCSTLADFVTRENREQEKEVQTSVRRSERESTRTTAGFRGGNPP